MKYFVTMTPMKVALIDRDGTVIIDPLDLRVDNEDKIKLFDDSIESLRYLADNGFSVIFITNQAGIEEGRLTEVEFWKIHEEVLRRLEPSGVKVLRTYMNGEMKRSDNTEWRKPGPNMLLQAAKDFNLDLSRLYMVGDNQSDIDAAINAGCKGGILVKTANENVQSPNAIFTAPRLKDAVEYIVKNTL
jgi:histidinol-phosphate phosphatase family protein